MTEATLRIKVDSSEVAKADRTLDDLAVSSGKAEKGTTQLTASTNSLSNAARAATGFLAAMGATIGVREIIAYSDAWRSAENQLRLVTTGTAELAGIQQTLLGVANNTRSSFESTANLYSRLARATTEMGLSQSELIGITNTINQSFAVSGATASEAAAAITQLSQGLAAGALRGDEFNSVAEQAPGIMRAIAESLNMTVGELRGFAAEGGITAEIVVTALQKAAGSIENDFSKANATFSQSMVVAKNNMLEFVGGSEAVKTATGAAGMAVVGLTENLDKLIPLAEIAAAIIGTRLVASLAAAATGMITATSAATALSGAMALIGGPAGAAVLAALALWKFVDSAVEADKKTRALSASAREYVNSGGAIGRMARQMLQDTAPVVPAVTAQSDALQEATYQSNEFVGAMERMTYVAQGFVGPMQEMTYVTEGFVGPLQEVTRSIQGATTATTQWQREQERATEAAQRQWEGTRDFLAETFVDIWNNGGSAFQKLGDMAVATAKRIVAEWAAVKALEFVGIKSPGGSSGVGGSLINTAVDIGIKALIGGGGGGAPVVTSNPDGFVGPPEPGLSSTATAAGPAATAASTAITAIQTAGAGYVGSQAGNKVGEEVFDKQAGSNIGSTIGSTVGAYFGGPLGAAIGGFIGGLGDVAFGTDGEFAGNGGFLIRGRNGGNEFDVPPFASGFDPVGFARRDSQGAAVQIIDTFRQYDAYLTEIAKASGLSVNYNSNNFGGFDEKGRGAGTFFGVANEGDSATNVPVEQQLTQFVGQWIRGLSGQVDQALISDVLAAGSADAMLARAASLAGVDGSHASGLDYVPFDGYVAQLHKGERVVPAAENMRGGAPVSNEMRDMITEMRKIALFTKRTSDLLLRVTRDGESLVTVSA